MIWWYCAFQHLRGNTVDQSTHVAVIITAKSSTCKLPDPFAAISPVLWFRCVLVGWPCCRTGWSTPRSSTTRRIVSPAPNARTVPFFVTLLLRHTLVYRMKHGQEFHIDENQDRQHTSHFRNLET